MTAPPPLRGFILQPTYRLERGRPVVHLWGRLEDGRTFLVRDRRPVPCFWIAAADAGRARELGAVRQAPSDKVTFGGEPTVRVELIRPSDTPPLRNRLQAAGIPCYEADVRFAMRYLIDRGIRGSLAIQGEGRPGGQQGVDLVFDEPELAPAAWTPRLSVLSFDLETDPTAERILSLALHGAGAREEVLLVTPPGYSCPPAARPVADERALLTAFAERLRALDPDVVTGWNVANFDFPVLERRARQLGVRLELGRGPGGVRRQAERSAMGSARVTLPGRVVADGVDLLRGAFVRLESYSLDAAAREILGEGKTITGHDRGEAILTAFERDRERLVAYNATDARLVIDVLDRLHLVELAVERSLLTGLPPDRVAASIAAFDFLYLSELGRRGVVADSVGGRAVGTGEATAGGHVLEPRPGLFDNVLVFDFQSLYPSLIRTFQIDPLGYLPDPAAAAEPEPITAPNGAAFRRRPGILTQLLDELLPRRRAAKESGDRVASFAIKILMNSFYGVLATPACRFFNPEIANAITSFGRELLLWTKGAIESSGFEVLYGDTDSLFVASGESDPAGARRLGERLAADLDRDLARHVEATWRVESRLSLELETLYLKLFLPAGRHGGAGARKRYVGLAEDESGRRRVVFTGMEAVRRDWTELARRLQRELYERLFTGRPVEEHLRRTVAALRDGRLDDQLVYTKTLKKAPSEYTSTTPPHVAAARKLPGKPRRRISYVITTAGPEPAAGRSSPLDYEHYVDRQIRPVAEPVLALLELDFRRVIGDDRQLSLF